MTDERGETPRPPEVHKKTPEPEAPKAPGAEAVKPVPEPDELLSKLQGEAARTLGVRQTEHRRGSSHT